MKVIFDLDGTLSDDRHRRHLVEQKPKRFPEYFRLAEKDPPYMPVVNLSRELYARPTNYISIWTGRPGNYREMTVEWLRRNGVGYDELLMRHTGDYTSTNTLKGRWLDNLEEPPDLVLDDREECCVWWESRGIPVLRVKQI